MFFNYCFAVRMQQAILLLLLSSALSLGTSFVYGATATTNEFTESKTLSLSEAVQNILIYNPSLQGFKPKLRQLDQLTKSANQNPGYQLGIETENLLGNGDYSDFDSTEVTISLSSVIELGDKRRYRTQAAHSRYQLEQTKMKVKTIDVLGRATQSFISLLTIQEQIKLAEQAVNLATTTLKTINAGVAKGATFKADSTRAQATLVQAQLHLSTIQNRFQSQKALLSVLWGQPVPQFGSVGGHLFSFNKVKPYQQLIESLQNTPALEVYTNLSRVRNAELELARSASQSDIIWKVGVKHDLANNSSGFNAGFSMPLFTQQRNRKKVNVATAAQESISYQQQAMMLQLQAKLYQAYQIQQQQMTTVSQLQNNVIPTLKKALKETSQAYRSGRYSYIEWLGVQQEMLNAQHMMIQAASNVLRNQSLIEQLTAQSLATISSPTHSLANPINNQD